MITPVELAERMKSEILYDVQAGVVPRTVSGFSELHDYVDANCYGGTEALYDQMDAGAEDDDAAHTAVLNALLDIMNPAMEIVDRWIKDGSIPKALR